MEADVAELVWEDQWDRMEADVAEMMQKSFREQEGLLPLPATQQ